MTKLLTIRELADLTGQHYDTIARKTRLGLIPAVYLPSATGRRPHPRFDPKVIESLLAGAE